ncbi:phage tail sheath subtilisin-like domain-containing protein [bacterium]|nr:phage tail sheath subtilisin-like domain-containing protein [bacterium]
MARTIQSPGVEINEIDLSLRPVLPAGTTILIPGYAKQGPINEVLRVNSLSEFEQVYGLPSTPAERYFYHTTKAAFNSNGNITVARLPYGPGTGEGVDDENYTALVYPAVGYNKNTSVVSEFVGTSVASITILSGGEGFSTAANVALDGNVTDGTGLTIDTSATVLAGDKVSSVTVLNGGTGFSYLYNESLSASAWGNGDTLVHLNETGGSGIEPAIGRVTFSTTVSCLDGNAGNVKDHDLVTGDALTWVAANGTDNAAASGSATYYVRKLSSSTFSIHSTSDGAFANTGAVNYPSNGSPTSAQKYSVTHNVATMTTLDATTANGGYLLGKPQLVKMNKTQYNNLVDHLRTDNAGTSAESNSAWNPHGTFDTGTNDFVAGIQFTADVNSLKDAGLIVINKSQTTNNNNYEGMYVGLMDNTNLNPATNFDGIQGVNGVNSSNNLISLPTTRLNFTLSGDSSSVGTVSETMEKLPDFDISNDSYSDTITLGLFKLRNSVFSQDVAKLDFILREAHVGSLDKTRKIQDRNGGAAKSFFMGNVGEASSDLHVLVNHFIAVESSGTWLGTDGKPEKHVRVITNRLLNDEQDIFRKLKTMLTDNIGDQLNGLGSYETPNPGDKTVGAVSTKLSRLFGSLENLDTLPLDITCEAGLGTIFATSYNKAGSSQTNSFDDTHVLDLGTSSDAMNNGFYQLKDNMELASAKLIRDNYNSVLNEFKAFAETKRKDHMFIADPLRQIFVQGDNKLILDDKKNTFNKNVYWPLRHLYQSHSTSYGATYANWGKVFDPGADKQIWVPMSGFIAATMANVDSNFQPWYAPAGFARGRLVGVNDVAVTPKQKSRDLLYTMGINPIALFPNEGLVVFGQKTLYKLPSAFDRINVRRLFLNLERAVRNTVKFYIFEPNTDLTRSNIVDNLSPIFENAKATQGLYDYLIVCDERNNTPDRIDQNELHVDIYIKPVRAAEYILVNFYATKTGQDFSEIVG